MMNTTQCTELPEHGIHVWRFPLIAARQEITSLGHWLSDHERAALDRMVSPTKRDRRLVAWGRLRFILSRYLDCSPKDIQIARTRLKRPIIAYPKQSGLWFNLSHSGSFGLVAVARNAVGVDIEKIDSSVGVERLSARFFSSGETEELRAGSESERIRGFFRLWVLKEAHLKSHGARVPAGLSQCEITFDDGPRIRRSKYGTPESWTVLTDIPVTKGYVAALAGLQERADISVFDL